MMSMKKILFSIMVIVLCGSLRAQNTVINDANAQVRSAKDFHAVEVSNAIDLYLSQSGSEAVAVSAKDIKNRDYIMTKVENGVLKIWFEKEGWRWNDGNKKLKAYVSFKTLDRLNASGASDVYVNGAITGDRLELHLSGASDFKGSVKLNALSLDQSGASDATINGIVGDLQVDVSGASETKGYELITDNCNAKATGASDISITVNKELNAHASGASSINYKGAGAIRDMHSSGASSVSKKG
jgi:hypothetical protein